MVREAISTVTTKNQTTVPKVIRQTLNLIPGDKIKYIINTNGSISISKSKESIDDMWTRAYELEKKYGNIDTPELEWGDDIESEDFD